MLFHFGFGFEYFRFGLRFSVLFQFVDFFFVRFESGFEFTLSGNNLPHTLSKEKKERQKQLRELDYQEMF